MKQSIYGSFRRKNPRETFDRILNLKAAEAKERKTGLNRKKINNSLNYPVRKTGDQSSNPIRKTLRRLSREEPAAQYEVKTNKTNESNYDDDCILKIPWISRGRSSFSGNNQSNLIPCDIHDNKKSNSNLVRNRSKTFTGLDRRPVPSYKGSKHGLEKCKPKISHSCGSMHSVRKQPHRRCSPLKRLSPVEYDLSESKLETETKLEPSYDKNNELIIRRFDYPSISPMPDQLGINTMNIDEHGKTTKTKDKKAKSRITLPSIVITMDARDLENDAKEEEEEEEEETFYSLFSYERKQNQFLSPNFPLQREAETSAEQNTKTPSNSSNSDGTSGRKLYTPDSSAAFKSILCSINS